MVDSRLHEGNILSHLVSFAQYDDLPKQAVSRRIEQSHAFTYLLVGPYTLSLPFSLSIDIALLYRFRCPFAVAERCGGRGRIETIMEAAIS